MTKVAIDHAHTRYAPDYLLILGATDIVPMQKLVNPMNADEDAGNDDDDRVVPSDLPYAIRTHLRRGSGGQASNSPVNSKMQVVGYAGSSCGSSDESLLLRGVRRRIVQRSFSPH